MTIMPIHQSNFVRIHIYITNITYDVALIVFPICEKVIDCKVGDL